MRIVTYNIWNSDCGMPERMMSIVDVLKKQQADVMCLQEVTGEDFSRIQTLFPGMTGFYDERYELAMLSRYPSIALETMEYAMGICAETDHHEALYVMNVHLPWDSILKREQIIVEIQKKAKQWQGMCILAGDFNSLDDSSVYRFLRGEQSLLGTDACWFDLAESDAEINGRKTSVTLDFRNNPRWGKVQPGNTIEKNQRFDRVFLRNPYPQDFPVLEKVEVFGNMIDTKIGLMPSDHYGVMVQINKI